MSDATAERSERFAALRDMYAALNRNDVPAFLAIYDAQVESKEPSGFPGDGTLHGIEALRELVTRMRGLWVEGTCEPGRMFAAGDKVVVFAHVHVRLKDEPEFREGDIADGYTFRDGKVVYRQVFVNRQDALAWAGIDVATAN